MSYTGRIFGLFASISTAIIMSIYSYYIYGPFDKIRIIRIILISIVLGVLCWWSGRKYDLMKILATHDALTELYNRTFVCELFPKILAQASRKGKKIGVFVIDVDNYKVINDEYGHKTGDIVLKNISEVLKGSVREEDIVARWGGDEFLIIVSCLKEQSSLTIIQQRIDNALKELSRRTKINITVSMGIAIFPDDAQTIDGLIKIADDNMYKVKLRKKQTVKKKQTANK